MQCEISLPIKKPLSLQAKRTDMKALWEHSGDGKSPIRGRRMAYPLKRGTGFFKRAVASIRICYYFCAIKQFIMLGIDTKRDVITGEFARKIWREVLSMWLKENMNQTEETNQKFEVEWL